MKQKGIKNYIKYLLVFLTLFLNFDYLYQDNITYASVNMFNISIAILFIIYLVESKYNKFKDISKSKKILSGLFSVFMIIGEIIMITGNFMYLFRIKYLILALIKLFGFYYLFESLFKLLNYYIDKLFDRKRKIKIEKNSIFSKYINYLEKYPFRTSFITILIFFSIYIIAFYPIVLSKDPSYQIEMYFNIPTKYITYSIQRCSTVFMTNHHPIAHTYLLGLCISIGRHILNDNFGLFIYTLIQTLILSSVLAYTIKVLNKNGVSKENYILVLLVYILVPMYGFYTVNAVKDTLYSAFIILFIYFIYDFIKNYKDKNIKWSYLVYFFIVMILICIFRQNGIYVILISLPFMVFFSKKNRYKILGLGVLVLSSMIMYNKVLIPALGITDGSIREALSVPFQQTARLALYHDDAISEGDKKIIDKVLGYNDLAKRYNPTLSDKVKNGYNIYTTKEDLKNYFKVWFKYLFKYPATYINATLNNTYGYFYPVSSSWYIYFDYCDIVVKDKVLDYHYNDLEKLRNVLIYYGTIYEYTPLYGLISSIGFGLFNLLIIISELIDKKKSKFIIVLMPLIVSILICFVGPANTYFRYAIPYLFVLPSLDILLIKETRK